MTYIPKLTPITKQPLANGKDTCNLCFIIRQYIGMNYFICVNPKTYDSQRGHKRVIIIGGSQ